MSNDALFESIKDATDLVQLVGGTVPLKKAGSSYKGLCPFHTEKTPSFTVSPARQSYHCWGCGAHGDAFDWLEATQGLAFIDAAKDLAARAGIRFPEQNTVVARKETKLFDANTAAARFFAAELQSPAGKQARQYLTHRGVTAETIETFGIGCVGDELRVDVDQATLLQAGLLSRREDDSIRPLFFRRVMFPIRDRRGRTIAFGGRTLHLEGKPKYMNSPETPIFIKSEALFGLDLAQKHIRQAGQAVFVEGYLDVVMLHQHGIQNTVAACGTAVTEQQIRMAFGMADQVVFAFDGDEAGRKAADRVIERLIDLLEDHHKASFVFFPEGEDPDSFVRKNGQEALRATLSKAAPLSQILCDRFTPAAGDALEARSGLAVEAAALLGRLTSAPTLRRLLTDKISALIGVPIQVKAPSKSVQNAARLAGEPRRAPGVPQPRPIVLQHVVEPVLKLLLAHPHTKGLLPQELLRQPIIAAAGDLVSRYQDLSAIINAVKGDKVLLRAIEGVAKGALERRDIVTPEQASIDAERTFANARSKLIKFEAAENSSIAPPPAPGAAAVAAAADRHHTDGGGGGAGDVDLSAAASPSP